MIGAPYEVRDGRDDPPRRVFEREADAVAFARRRSAQLGHPLQIWRWTAHGEEFVGIA